MGGGDSENTPVLGNGIAPEDLSDAPKKGNGTRYANASERKAARLATDKRSKDKAKAKKAKDKEEQRAKDIKFRSMEKRVENDAQRKKTLSEATAENASLKAVIASLRKYKTNLERLVGSKVQQQVSAQKKLNREIKLLKEDTLELKSANAQLQEEVRDLVRVVITNNSNSVSVVVITVFDAASHTCTPIVSFNTHPLRSTCVFC